jgi:hypothetical protein
MPIVSFYIRKAVKEDFFDINNQPRYGTMFFLKNSKGEFDKQPYYLTIDLDKKEFKTWFKNNQVYVFTRFLEEIENNE